MAKVNLLQFPGEFSIKAMGKANLEFEALVVGIVRQYVPQLSEGAVRLSHSKNEHFVSVTVTFRAESRKQVNAIYQALSDDKRVLMVL